MTPNASATARSLKTRSASAIARSLKTRSASAIARSLKKRTFKMIEPNPTAQMDGAPYHEIAIYVRDLLRCDYALVALLEEDSIRIRGFVGPEGDADESVGPDLISRLRNWGPVIVDDASLVASPVSSGGNVEIGRAHV